MYPTYDGQIFYLRSWEFNVTRVFNRLNEIITKKGGTFASADRNARDIFADMDANRKRHYVVDRGIKERIDEKQSLIDTLHRIGKPATELENEVAELRKIPNDPVEVVNHSSYLGFTLQGCYYYIQVENNPFFPTLYMKASVSERRVPEVYLTEFTSEQENWKIDDMLRSGCPQETINRVADTIMKMLLTAPCCGQVCNKYKGRELGRDGRWHNVTRYKVPEPLYLHERKQHPLVERKATL